MLEMIAQATTETAGWQSSLLLAGFLVALGLVFILAEIFFISFGLLTLCSLGSFAGGVVVAFNAGEAYGITFIILVVILIPFMIAFGLKFMPRTHWGRRLMPKSPTPREVTATGVKSGLGKLLGKEGRTMSMCRPAGTAEFDGERHDVVSEGLTIPPDRPVKVVRVEGNRIVVRELEG